MISVGGRDGRKGIGLGFGTGSEMEGTELEEGEACSYLTDDYSAFDPDVALSYIDVKIQDVLGHFQKDFEGGVSAENLGAKFGGYGSFLPTYQRSPVWSHPRTPAKVQNSNTSTSLYNLHQEGGHRKSVFPPNASLSVRYGQASETGSSLPLVRESVNDSEKRDAGVLFAHCAEELTSGLELEKKYDQHSDQKSLKVHIKVSSDNLPTQKKAEIYSGLGLDLSPPSSSDYIPSNSEGFSRGPKEGPDESPTSILQIMTSFPVHGNLLLSPLPDDLITLTEKERSHGESKPRLRQKDSKESSHRSDSGRSDEKYVGVKKSKSFQRKGHLVELKNLINKGIQTDNGILLKKEADIESVDCEELVDNALKLQILSNSCSNVADSTKSNARAVDDFRAVNNVKEESLEAVSTQETGLVEKPSGKACSAGKTLEEKNANFNGDMSYPRKDGTIKREEGYISANSIVSKGRKSQNAEPIDPLEQKISQKSTSLEADDMKLASGMENSSSGGKKKLKESQNHSTQDTEVPKDSSRMDSSFVPQNRNSSHADLFHPESEVGDSKVHKDDGKASDRYRDFFGDIELEEGDNYANSPELLSAERQKDFEAVENSTVASDRMLNAISNGKKMDEPLASEAYSKATSSAAPMAENGSISDASPGTSVPLVKEDWVCCDKCLKWRLLPLGANPDSLPEKWLCSMLYWLPGLNRCSVSEDETTKALTQYQVSAPVNQNNLQGHREAVLPLADASHFDQNSQSSGLHALPSGGKKKNGVKNVPGPLSNVGLARLSNSMKKNLPQAVKNSSLNGVNKSPPASVITPTHLSKSTVVKKSRHIPKEKNKPLERHSDGGETSSSKIKSKRDNDQDSFRISKKTKIDGGMNCNNADLPKHDGPAGKVGPGSSIGNASRKDSHKYGDHSSKDGGCEANNRSKGPGRNPKDQVQGTSDDRCLDIKKENDEDLVSRKRKVNESHDRNIYTPSPRTGHHDHDRRDFIEQTNENLHKKEKRARVSESEGKDTSVSRNSDRSARKGRRTKDQQSGPYLTQRSLDGTNSLRWDSGSLQPSQAAMSSSSKVSGSCKSKSNMQERKSSPVESVSSSPLRLTHPDTSALTRTSHEGKNGFGIVGLFATCTPRRGIFSDDKWSNKSKTVKKDETSVTNSFAVDFLERDIGQLAGSEAKIEIMNSAELDNGGTDTLGNGTRYPFKPQASDKHFDEGRGSEKQYHANASHSTKSGKGSSSRSKDNIGNLKTKIDKDKVKNSGSCNKSIDHMPYEEKLKAGKNRFREDFGANSDKTFQGKKEPAGKVISKNYKRESQSKYGEVGSLDVKLEALSDKTDRTEVSGRGKSLPPSRRGQNVLLAYSLPSNAGPKKEGGGNGLLNDGSEGGDALKAPKQNHKSDNQNGNQLSRSRHATNNGHRVRDVDAPSPATRRDSSNPATNALKAAKDLKHLADRLKNSGSSAESTGLYFQAALKFLHGASLLESTNGESAKQSDMIQSMQIYSSTAKLCEFCAHEFDKCKDMAAAALAYKCTEVAYMRVVYSSRSGASRDRHELQAALQIIPHGESPSSSASDVDNVNNLATLDKVPLSKGVSSPQLAGNHASSAQNRPSFARLLIFTQDVNYAMEASRKSRLAFAAANLRKEEALCREGITSVKTALDFNFQDMEGLLHLVRLAMEAIGR